MNEPESQDQLEAKLITAPRRVWTVLDLVARAERRKSCRDQAAIILERECARLLARDLEPVA